LRVAANPFSIVTGDRMVPVADRGLAAKVLSSRPQPTTEPSAVTTRAKLPARRRDG